MAKSAALPLALGGFASILVISGIQGETIGEVIKGEFGKGSKYPTPPASGPSPRELAELSPVSQNTEGTNIPQPQFASYTGTGLVSPFPRSSGQVAWGRSDQGVDGVVKPGSPLLAIGNGVIEIGGPDPGGFGDKYPILKIDNDGSFYYGHSIPALPQGTRVRAGETIGFANTHGQGNATTPGAFEIGRWPPGNFTTAGQEIREWFIHLPRL